MASLDTLNNSCELSITPSRKRKRQFNKNQQQQKEVDTLKSTAVKSSCFTNAAFSSTPKKILGKRRLPLVKTEENVEIFPKIGLEVKSIAEIALQEADTQVLQNPYEVVRKPPKKKKRHSEEAACFENPALNLDLPEKQFNPYEVVREVCSNKTTSNCFSNPALNLKIQDASAIRNPFEVQRFKNETELAPSLKQYSVPSGDAKQTPITIPKPCNIQIGLPFVPTVGCRIDFKDISMSQLTPSKLLAEKLVFSPVLKAKVSLGSVGEETTMDIGKELDRYQLELENSINEAKLRKNGSSEVEEIQILTSSNPIQTVDIEKSAKFTLKLTDIAEAGEDTSLMGEISKHTEHHVKISIQNESHPIRTEPKLANTNPFLPDINNELQKRETAEVVDIEPENIDDLYGCDEVDDDSFDFQAPAPFVRAYAKPTEHPKLRVSKESLEADKSIEHNKKAANVKNIIRKSIRKLMHSSQQNDTEHDSPGKSDNEKPNGFISAIRQSLRRKPAKNISKEISTNKENEISIIDSTERTIKLKSDQIQTEYVKIEDLTNERKQNVRSSLRKSTREVRNQFMKSVFNKKYEEYDFNKF